MKLIIGLLDRMVLVAAVLLGSSMYGFILSYRQRISGHLEQSLKDLYEFQKIADKYNEGSLESLIETYKVSLDPIMQDTGLAVENIWLSSEKFRILLDGLQGNLFQKITVLMSHYDKAQITATWEIYEPSVIMSVDGLQAAAIIGGSVWLVFLAIITILKYIIVKYRKKHNIHGPFQASKPM